MSDSTQVEIGARMSVIPDFPDRTMFTIDIRWPGQLAMHYAVHIPTMELMRHPKAMIREAVRSRILDGTEAGRRRWRSVKALWDQFWDECIPKPQPSFMEEFAKALSHSLADIERAKRSPP